jgi:hypothetical protein
VNCSPNIQRGQFDAGDDRIETIIAEGFAGSDLNLLNAGKVAA